MSRGELQISLCYDDSDRKLRTRLAFVRNVKLPDHVPSISDSVDLSGRCHSDSNKILFLEDAL